MKKQNGVVIPKPGCGFIEEDGVVYFSVVSQSQPATWQERAESLKKKGINITDSAEGALRWSGFTPTSSVVTEVAILKKYFSEDGYTRESLDHEAEQYGWTKPGMDLGCLILENLSKEELRAMDIKYAAVMSEPFRTSCEAIPQIFDVRVLDERNEKIDGYAELGATIVIEGCHWTGGPRKAQGFAYVVSSQVVTDTQDQ